MSPTSLSSKNGLIYSLWRQGFDVSICNEGFNYLLATSSSSRWSFKSEERFFISVLWLSISFLTSSIIIFLTFTVLQDSKVELREFWDFLSFETYSKWYWYRPRALKLSDRKSTFQLLRGENPWVDLAKIGFDSNISARDFCENFNSRHVEGKTVPMSMHFSIFDSIVSEAASVSLEFIITIVFRLCFTWCWDWIMNKNRLNSDKFQNFHF